MRYRVLLIASGLLAASASVYGQASLTGKWQTDNVPAALEAQKNAPAAPEAGGRGGGRGGPQAIMLDLQVLVKLRGFICGQGERLLTVDQFRDAGFRHLRGTEVDDALRGGAPSEEVHEFFICEDHVFVTMYVRLRHDRL